MDNLLKDLGDRGGNHISPPLEITADHTHNGEDKNGWRHNLQGQGTAWTFENRSSYKITTQQENQCHQSPGDCTEGHTADIDPLHILILSADPPCGNQLGHSQRKAVGGQNQPDIIDLIGSIVIAHTFLPQDPDHRNFVEKSDETDKDAGNSQNTALDQQVAGIGCFFASAGWICHGESLLG